jgi:glycosyltransferase involved in cell wall biosynthesis
MAFLGSRMRIGFVSTVPLADPVGLSGMPYATFRSLAHRGLDVVPFEACDPGDAAGSSHGPMRAAVRRLIGVRAGRVLRDTGRDVKQACLRPIEHRMLAALARRYTERVQRHLATTPVDVVIGVCISLPLADLETRVPIVYCTDATARLINTGYPEYANRSVRYQQACDDFERRAMSRVTRALFPTRMAMRSAVDDYGLHADRARIVPFGANVVPDSGTVGHPEPPTRTRVELVIIAADPVRKRVDFCVEIAEELQRRGVKTVLHHIGSGSSRVRTSPIVVDHGRLALSRPEDRVVHQEVLSRCHFLLQPSSSEMYGLATAEAAHHGCPSIVSDAGGLPEAVLDGETGIVMPSAATASDYAERIEAALAEPEAYRKMSAAALARARRKLTWNAWAESTEAVLREVTGTHASP